MNIQKEIDFSKPLTDDQLAMLNKMETCTIQPDSDCPELTDEQLIRFAEAAREKRQKTQNKQTVAIRLSPQALEKAQSLGKGYTSVLSRILEAALADNETLRHYL